MGWATLHIAKLKAGETVKFRPKGNSMSPRIESGQLCTVAPVTLADVRQGDVVLCTVRGRQFLHLVSAIKDGQLQISNNKNHVNGWIGPNSVFGILTKVED